MKALLAIAALLLSTQALALDWIMDETDKFTKERYLVVGVVERMSPLTEFPRRGLTIGCKLVGGKPEGIFMSVEGFAPHSGGYINTAPVLMITDAMEDPMTLDTRISALTGAVVVPSQHSDLLRELVLGSEMHFRYYTSAVDAQDISIKIGDTGPLQDLIRICQFNNGAVK